MSADDPFIKYERTPKEVQSDTQELHDRVNWDNQTERRSAKELQELNQT